MHAITRQVAPIRSLSVVLSAATLALFASAFWMERPPRFEIPERVPHSVVATTPWAEPLRVGAAEVAFAGERSGRFDLERLSALLAEYGDLTYIAGPSTSEEVVSLAVPDAHTAVIAVRTASGQCQLARITLRDGDATWDYGRAAQGACRADTATASF